jgi:hypothetical protein
MIMDKRGPVLVECTSKSGKCYTEDNENILYLGTDSNAVVCFFEGKSWEDFSNGV